jgi:type IV secretory pathway VirB4 component
MELIRALARRQTPPPSAGSWFGPGGIEVHAKHLQIDGVYAATLTLTGYPAEVLPGWLETIYTYPARIDVAIHAEPVAPLQAASRLRKQRARLEAGRRGDADKGRLDDPVIEAAAADAAQLAHRVARSSAKLFKAAIHLAAYADSQDELAAILAEVKGLLAAQLASVTPATFRQVEGWTATLPVGVDRLGPARTLETSALAACLPIASADLTRLDDGAGGGVSGVLWGLNTATGNPVFWDRWGQQNHNSVVLGASGSGKSYLAKTDVLRELYQGATLAVIDPEGEYAALAAAVGGTVVALGSPGARINPLDLPDPHGAAPDTLARRTLDLHALVGVLVGEHDADEGRAALDRAALTAYQDAGITQDPRTWSAPAPDLAAVNKLLRQNPDTAAQRLAARLDPFSEAFHLSSGERAFLLTCPRGNALMSAADGSKTTFASVAEPAEAALLQTGIGA